MVRGGKGVVTAWRDDLWLSAPVTNWHQAHGGIAGITPRRGSLVSDGVLVGGHKLRVINGHRINGTGWPGVRKLRLWTRRRNLWRKHDSLDRQLMFAALDQGAHVVLGADVNRSDMPSPHPTAVPLRDDGITQLWYIPAPNRRPFTSDNRGRIHPRTLGITGTGHHLQWADLNLA